MGKNVLQSFLKFRNIVASFLGWNGSSDNCLKCLICVFQGEVMKNKLPALTFPWLRHLEVIKVATFRQDLGWVAIILKTCPVLRRLELHVSLSVIS